MRRHTPGTWRQRRKRRRRADRRLKAVTRPREDHTSCGHRAVERPERLRQAVRDRRHRLMAKRGDRRRLTREVVRQHLRRSLDDRSVVRAARETEGTRRAIHRLRHVRHVDQSLDLERTRADNRVLCDLVPLLDRIAGRQGRSCVPCRNARQPRKGADHGEREQHSPHRVLLPPTGVARSRLRLDYTSTSTVRLGRHPGARRMLASPTTRPGSRCRPATSQIEAGEGADGFSLSDSR